MDDYITNKYSTYDYRLGSPRSPRSPQYSPREYSPNHDRSQSPYPRSPSPMRSPSPNNDYYKKENYLQSINNSQSLGLRSTKPFLPSFHNSFKSKETTPSENQRYLSEYNKEYRIMSPNTDDYFKNKNYSLLNYEKMDEKVKNNQNSLSQCLKMPNINAYHYHNEDHYGNDNKNVMLSHENFEKPRIHNDSHKVKLLMNRMSLDKENKNKKMNKYYNKNFKGFRQNERDFSYNLFNLDIESKIFIHFRILS